MSQNRNDPVKEVGRKRPPKVSPATRLLMTALSLSAFVGGWSLVAHQEGEAQTEPPPLPTSNRLTQATATPWPTIEPLTMLPPIPTVAPLAPGRFEQAKALGVSDDLPLAVQLPAASALPPLPTLAPLPAAPQTSRPASSQTVAVPVDLNVAPGQIALIGPLDANTNGPVVFEWVWNGPIPENHGFEIMVWRPGEPQVGAHDAVADNLAGRVVSLGSNRYRLALNIRDVAGVRGRSGDYRWTVSLVQIQPAYANHGIQAPPATIRLDLGGGEGGGRSGGGGGNGGGNVSSGS